MITIYHVEGARSERVVWLMEELGLPYKLEFTPGDPMSSMQTLRAQHPMGYAPTVRDGDVVLIESGAIFDYIMARYGGGQMSVPADSPDFPHYIQWFHMAEGQVAHRLILEYMMYGFGPNPGEKFLMAGHLVGGARRIMDYTESVIATRPYFGGQQFTAADLLMHFCIQMAHVWRMDFSVYPALEAWYQKVIQRPAFKRMREVSLPNGFLERPGGWHMQASDW